MPTKQRNDLKAGLFIVISIALIIAIVIGIKGASAFLQPMQRHAVRFALADDIGGLAQGDQVRIGGAKVGTVRDIALLLESDPPGIVITFEIPRKFKLKSDAQLTIQTTVTGVSVLNIESLGSGPMLTDKHVLAGKPGASIAALVNNAQGFLADARTVALPKINSAVDTVKDKGAYALTEIGSLFGDTKPDFRGTLHNLNVATGDIKDKLPGLLEKTDGTLTKIGKALDNTNDALLDVKQVAANTREASAAARSILTTNRGKIDGMIASLKTAGDNLKFATAEIRRSPWRLLYKPAAGEMANLNLYDSARQFAEGAGSMEEAATALRDALKDPDVDQHDVEKLVEKLDKSFANFTSVESALWKQVKE